MSKIVRMEERDGDLVVKEIFEGEKIPPMHSTLKWRDDAPDDVDVGWRFDGKNYLAPEPAKSDAEFWIEPAPGSDAVLRLAESLIAAGLLRAEQLPEDLRPRDAEGNS